MEVLANVTFLHVKDPNCKVRLVTGCRPTIRYEGEIGACCTLDLGVQREAQPGDVMEIEIAFLSPDNHQGKISVGQSFELYAGPWLIAKGDFTWIN